MFCDDAGKHSKTPFSVIPAKAGIQTFYAGINFLDPGACFGPDPGFTEVTAFCESIFRGPSFNSFFFGGDFLWK